MLRARKILPEADILVTHAFWAPLLLPKDKFGKIYVHVGRYPKGQMCIYKKADRLQVPTQAVARAVAAELQRGMNGYERFHIPCPFQFPQMYRWQTALSGSFLLEESTRKKGYWNYSGHGKL